MNQKLTLSIDSTAIARGKNYAKKNGRSLSSMVENFLLLLDDESGKMQNQIPISGKLMSLVGISKGTTTEEDYHRHLIERYDA